MKWFIFKRVVKELKAHSYGFQPTNHSPDKTHVGTRALPHQGNPSRASESRIQVALCVGTLLFTINHGSAVINGEMSAVRWASGLLTYTVPFMVSIHGQSSRRAQM